MDMLISEILALLFFFGSIALIKFRLLGIVTVLLFIAGVINLFLYKGVFILILACLLSLLGIAWKVHIRQWKEYY